MEPGNSSVAWRAAQLRPLDPLRLRLKGPLFTRFPRNGAFTFIGGAGRFANAVVVPDCPSPLSFGQM